MSNVYYKEIDQNTSIEEVKKITQELSDTMINEEKIVLEKEVPLKVHFGEKGNVTFIKSENYEGIIDYLTKKGINTCYMETNVMYGGQRYKEELYVKTAKEHGFTQIPIVIADGSHGEDYKEVEINKNHFKSSKIGKRFMDYNQIVVISHFKGHLLAGFGGAMKQLSMEHAAKGDKLAMHMGIKPHIINRKCKKCNVCMTRCNEGALVIEKKSYIDHNKCVGCGACMAACPHKAISIISIKGIMKALWGNNFREKLIEYAYAAQKNKNNMYMNFVLNITNGCDCEPRKMKPVMEDLGIFASADPVAIDRACYDRIKEKGKKFRGFKQFSYAEQIGLGLQNYKLVEV